MNKCQQQRRHLDTGYSENFGGVGKYTQPQNLAVHHLSKRKKNRNEIEIK